MAKTIQVGDLSIGRGGPLALIAGPCVIESRDVCLHVAERVRRIADRLGLPFIFKSSYSKDNRQRSHRHQGLKPSVAKR